MKYKIIAPFFNQIRDITLAVNHFNYFRTKIQIVRDSVSAEVDRLDSKVKLLFCAVLLIVL